MRKSLLITSLLATSFLACGVAAMNNVSAKADTADFATAFGASVRVSDPNGIRFKLQLSEEKKNEIFAENSGKELGMYIMLGSKAGTDYSALTQKIDIEFEEKDLYKEGDAWFANGVMTNLYVQTFNKEFVGVGYIATTTAEGTTYEYSAFNAEDNVRSMSGVALEAYKAEDNQEAMLALIEKAAYAEYGVVETRKTENGVINYTFAKGEEAWTSYEAMQEAIPVTLSVAEGNLLVGETLDLGAALAINGTKLTKLDLPFTYTVEGNAVTLENGVVKAVGAGTANVTVAFGEWSKTVTINAQEAANVVFNPASVTANAQVTYNGAAFNSGAATQTFVSDEKNTSDVYGGAYMTLKTTKTGSWGNVYIKPAHEMSAYEGYDAVSVWMYVGSTKGETLSALLLGGDADTQRWLTTNKWVQVTIPMSKFMEKGDGSLYFNSLKYTASINSIAIGEMKAINYEELPETLVFDPAMGNLQQIALVEQTAGVYTNALRYYVSAEENADATYGGAYFRIVPNTVATDNKYGYVDVAPIHGTTAYAGYTHVKVWFYLETKENFATATTICGATVNANSNEWVSIELPIETFVSGHFFNVKWSNKDVWNITGIRLGEIVAYKEEVSTDVFVFDPSAEDALSYIRTANKGFNYGNKATYSVVSVNSDTIYNGAYVKINSTAITSSNLTGDVYIKPISALNSYSQYTTIKVWIYLEATGNTNATLFVYGAAYGESIPSNQWKQIEIPVSTFIQADEIRVGVNLCTNASWGIQGIRIGEITAVK